MKKSRRFDELSRVECAVKGCRMLLKKRIAEEHPTFGVCFKHFKVLKNMGLSTKKARTGAHLA
jgi:hypothetical protein